MSLAPQPLTPVESNDPIMVPKRVAMVRPDTRPTLRRREEKWVMTFPHLIVREVIMFMTVVIGLALIALFFNAPLEGLANPLETPNPSKAPWYFLGLQELLHYFPPVVAGVVIPGLVVTALVVIPYARINLVAGPLWSGNRKRLTTGITAVTGVLVILFSAFQCWAIVVPSLIVAAAMFVARSEGSGSPFRRFLALVTLPEWVMTWFVLVAAILTLIGTFFRGPGWSLVWPWNMYPPA
jgi:quinol-cytochrome oxidoreductase complex cytochrome b subunit